MKRFLVVLGIAALFGFIVLVAGTAQNQGCLPWQEPVRVGGGPFSDDRGQRLCR
ncbi:MAG TPA: hypothetical protein VMK83_09900 [Gaiellaceae bacterium]|nr:hypothetical protein [Gaiellaceae bacterium]